MARGRVLVDEEADPCNEKATQVAVGLMQLAVNTEKLFPTVAEVVSPDTPIHCSQFWLWFQCFQGTSMHAHTPPLPSQPLFSLQLICEKALEPIPHTSQKTPLCNGSPTHKDHTPFLRQLIYSLRLVMNSILFYRMSEE